MPDQLKYDKLGATWTGFLKEYHTQIAAGTSSVLSTFTTFPLDSMKNRMQTYKFDGFWDCVRKTHKEEGFRGFWRGSMAPLMSVTLVRTISFSIYTSSQKVYKGAYESLMGDTLKTEMGSFPHLSNLGHYFLSGATAGAAITFIACPFEFTKLNSQLEHLLVKDIAEKQHLKTLPKISNGGTYASAKRIVQSRGFRGLYSGVHLHLARDTLGTGLYFTLYETFKQTFSNKTSGASPWLIAASGGACGLLSWAMIYPIDSAKSIYQKKVLATPPGVPLPKLKYRLFSHRMYRALGVSMARSCLLNAIFFSSYEWGSKAIAEL